MKSGRRILTICFVFMVNHFHLISTKETDINEANPTKEVTTTHQGIVDKGTLEKAVVEAEKEFKRIQDILIAHKKKIGVLAKSDEVADSLEKLKLLKTNLDSLHYNVTFLSEKSILLRNVIPRIVNDQIRGRLNFLKLWIPSDQTDLGELIHAFDCRYKSKFLQENLRNAEVIFFARVKQAGNIHRMCDDFSESCIGNYTSLLVNIDEYNKTHVNPLKEQLTSLQTDCEPSVGLLSNKVDLLEKRVEVWAVNILLNLKNLMEARFNHLRDASKYHCHRLNEMRLASKDNRNNPEELRKIQDRMKSLGVEAQTTHETFEQVFSDLNIFIQRNEKLFAQCLEEATDLRYLIIGFQLQVDEYVEGIGKRIRLASFQKGFEEFEKELDLFGKSLKENRVILKDVPVGEMCSKVDTLSDVFSEELHTNLNQLEVKLKSLEIKSVSLTDCEEDYTTIQSNLAKSRETVDMYLLNNHPYMGFLEVFNKRFCN